MKPLGLFKKTLKPSRTCPAKSSPAKLQPPVAPAVTPAVGNDAPPDEHEQSDSGPWWQPKGPAVVEVPEPGLDLAGVDRELASQLAGALENANLELPPLPRVAQRVMCMLGGQDADFKKIADLVCEDQVLAAEVLRVVNSPAYRGNTEIRRLDLAFARLGQRALRALMLRVSVKAVTIRSGGGQQSLGRELWRCSLASGTILEHMSRLYSLPEEDAFLVGLLHDIGMVAVLKLIQDYQRSSGQQVPRAVFDSLGHKWHQELGQRLSAHWNLPDPLPAIIGDHHGDPSQTDPLRLYRLLVQFADVTCAMMGYTTYVPYDFFAVRCIKALGLEDDQATRTVLDELGALLRERSEVV